jgi:hypothetical protein
MKKQKPKKPLSAKQVLNRLKNRFRDIADMPVKDHFEQGYRATALIALNEIELLRKQC